MSTKVVLPEGTSTTFEDKVRELGVSVVRTNNLTPPHERSDRPVLRRPGHDDVVGMAAVFRALKS